MKYKYLILDFGNVIATPSGLDWDITPKFLELVDFDSVDKDKFNEARLKHIDLLSEVMTTLEEEYDMFTRFYDGILSNIDLPNYNKKIAEEIAYDRTYKNNKYK